MQVIGQSHYKTLNVADLRDAYHTLRLALD